MKRCLTTVEEGRADVPALTSMISANLKRSRPRVAEGVFSPQVVSKASRAAFTARSTSATDAVSMVARSSSVAGL